MSESITISPADSRIEAREEASFAKAAAVAEPLKAGKSFFDWLDLGDGLAALRDRAMRQSCSNSPFGKGYTQRYAALKAEHPWAGIFDPGTISNAIWVHENRSDVTRWRDTLSSKQRQEWITPKVVRQHYEKAHKIAEAKKDGVEALSPMAKQRAAIIELEEENTRLKREAARRQAEGSLFDLKRDSIESIVDVVAGSVALGRFESLQRAMTKKLAELKVADKAKTAKAG
jgi:hypothetical protein